ncbi:CHAT domain-containing protein [Hypoxylon argillaceum]|nr:CHAT domain-containing protein [Hypoxylon argillaceum]
MTTLVMDYSVTESGISVESLTEAICKIQAAIEAAPSGTLDHAERLNTLGTMLRDRFRLAQSSEDLRESANSFMKAVKITPVDHPDRPKRLQRLAMRRFEIFDRTLARTTLNEAVIAFEEAIDATPSEEPDRAALLNNLASLIAYRGNSSSTPADLGKAAGLFSEAVKATPVNDLDRPNRLSNLASMLGSIYNWSGDLMHLDGAIRGFGEAASLVTNDSQRVQYLRKQRPLLNLRARITGSLPDVIEVISNYRAVISLPVGDDTDRGFDLSELGTWLSESCKMTNDQSILEEAIHYSREAVNITPAHNPDWSKFAGNLSTRLSERYYMTGHIDDLNEAIRMLQQAISAAQANDLGGLYTNLAILLRYRYNTTQELEDINGSISSCRSAVSVTPAKTPNRAKMLTHLGVMLGDRYNRTKSLDDLEEATRCSQEAVEENPGRPDKEICLNNLGLRLGEKYDRTKDLNALSGAIENHRRAINETLPTHLNRAMFLNNLGMRLAERYIRCGASDDLDEAIQLIQEAGARVPPTNPDRSGLLLNLGNKQLLRYQQSARLDDLQAAQDSFQQAMNMEIGLPMERIKAARALGNTFVDGLNWTRAIEAFEAALKILQRLDIRSLPRADQQWILRELSGISSDAASCILQAERPASEALEFLEAGRCIITTLGMNFREEIVELRDADSDLYSEYERRRQEISQFRADPGPGRSGDYESRAALLRRKLDDLAETETKIRSLRGFEHFQLPLQPTEMMSLAKDGPIVAFNVSKTRSDAIIATSTKIWSVSLPDFTQRILEDIATFFSDAGSRSRRNGTVRVNNSLRSAQLQLEANLLRLWNIAVFPVLKEFGKEQYRRIWWVAGGAIGRLPFHAAGDHSEGSRENTISHLISSYTSTLKALHYASKKRGHGESEGRMLLVDMPNTPQHQALDTQHEVKVIQEEFGDRVDILRHPSRKMVLEGLRGCVFAHFACHGVSNPQDPSEGGLILVEDGRPKLLTIRELDEVNLQSAEVAYLSACSTAELVAGELVDEAIHLSNSYQSIGFRHAIGTMWGADDYAAGEIARSFYKESFSHFQQGVYSEYPIAEALHKALVEFRNKPGMRGEVIKWGAFIHVGV